MFITDKTKVACRMSGIERRVVYILESCSILEELRVSRLADWFGYNRQILTVTIILTETGGTLLRTHQ